MSPLAKPFFVALKRRIFLLIALAELIVFILISSYLGFINSLLLILLSTLAGAVLLRKSSKSFMQKLKENFSPLEFNSRDMRIFLIGLLLLIPGFLSSLLALILTNNRAKRAIFAKLKSYLQLDSKQYDSHIIDLKKEEYSQRKTDHRD